MAILNTGIFTLKEFVNRNVLKLAPDGFITINGSLGSRVVTPLDMSNTKDIDVRGGVSSISVTGAVSPPGSNTATIEVIAPQHAGLHEDYYVTLPTGVKVPFFTPMMEVKVYMKGRFLDANDGYKAKYYPVFWGFITDISENYSGGVHTFSIKCSDMLTWWKYQKITLKPSADNTLFGGPVASNVPTIFENKNPWQIIVALFNDTFFMTESGAYNFVYPKFSKTGYIPDIGRRGAREIGETFSAIARNAIDYWNKRFGFILNDANQQGERIPLEIFSLRGKTINYKDIDIGRYSETPAGEKRKAFSASLTAVLDLDYNMLARIMPFGQLSLYGDGAESLEMTKLEIANAICEQSHLEFFSDMNGSFVFKPPFYNMDTLTGDVPYYNIKSSEIISFNSNINTDNIVTYLEVTSPQRYDDPDLELIGFHIDYDLLKQFGLRYESVALRYGNDARTLRLLAAAEMARINGRAYTGSASIPLRPELRLGYPVYIDHLDAYFYVTGISHNITFGSSASTDLTLEFRRDRIFDPDGTIGKGPEPSYAGKILKGYVYRFSDRLNLQDPPQVPVDSAVKAQVELERKQERLTNARDKITVQELNREIKELENVILKDTLQRANNIISGPKTTGLYEIDIARKRAVTIESSGTPDAIVSNEMLMISDDTAPYTDINGYRHIGAFPYGANLKLSRGGISDSFDRAEAEDAKVSNLLNAGAFKEIASNVYINNQDETVYQFGTESLNTIESRTKQQLIEQQNEKINNSIESEKKGVKDKPDFENDPTYNPKKILPTSDMTNILMRARPRNSESLTLGSEAGNEEQPFNNYLYLYYDDTTPVADRTRIQTRIP